MLSKVSMAAVLAQEESCSKSENIKWGIRQSFRQGKVNFNYTKFLGYTKDADGNIVIVPREAGVVKNI